MTKETDENISEFTKIMENSEEPYRMIVYGDAVRRIDVWRNKGIKNRTICEGLVKAALESIVDEEDPREWRWFWTHVIQEAENHKNRLEAIFVKSGNEGKS